MNLWSMEVKMNKKIAIVTGASSGIGKITAEMLSQQGFYVFAMALESESLRAMKNDNMEPVAVDATSDEGVKAAVEYVLKQTERIDLLINGASFGHPGAVECLPIPAIQKQFDVNVFGYARFIQAVLPAMRAQRGGRIINISSSAGRMVTPSFGWYCATKFAVEGFSDALRQEVKQFGVDVVLIEPGVIKTPFLERQAELLNATYHPKEYEGVVKSLSKVAGEKSLTFPPQMVAKEIVKAALKPKPPIRVLVPRSLNLLLIVKSFVGDRFWDWAIRRSFSL